MNQYLQSVYDMVKAKNPAEPEFHQAVSEVLESLYLRRSLSRSLFLGSGSLCHLVLSIWCTASIRGFCV